jgi:hypothetical protein
MSSSLKKRHAGAVNPFDPRTSSAVQAQLIEDLLDLGRNSSGKMALEITSVDIGNGDIGDWIHWAWLDVEYQLGWTHFVPFQ